MKSEKNGKVIIIVCVIAFILGLCIVALDPTPYEPWAVEDCPVCDGLGYIKCSCGEIYDCSACE